MAAKVNVAVCSMVHPPTDDARVTRVVDAYQRVTEVNQQQGGNKADMLVFSGWTTSQGGGARAWGRGAEKRTDIEMQLQEAFDNMSEGMQAASPAFLVMDDNCEKKLEKVHTRYGDFTNGDLKNSKTDGQKFAAEEEKANKAEEKAARAEAAAKKKAMSAMGKAKAKAKPKAKSAAAKVKAVKKGNDKARGSSSSSSSAAAAPAKPLAASPKHFNPAPSNAYLPDLKDHNKHSTAPEIVYFELDRAAGKWRCSASGLRKMASAGKDITNAHVQALTDALHQSGHEVGDVNLRRLAKVDFSTIKQGPIPVGFIHCGEAMVVAEVKNKLNGDKKDEKLDESRFYFSTQGEADNLVFKNGKLHKRNCTNNGQLLCGPAFAAAEQKPDGGNTQFVKVLRGADPVAFRHALGCCKLLVSIQHTQWPGMACADRRYRWYSTAASAQGAEKGGGFICAWNMDNYRTLVNGSCQSVWSKGQKLQGTDIAASAEYEYVVRGYEIGI